MMNVFVIDKNKKVCNPVHPGTARLLLKKGKAVIFRQFPFTIILKVESHETVKPLRLKIDPGSKTTGVAVINAAGEIIFIAEIHHRRYIITEAMTSRGSVKRSRRSRNTRYRKPRFNNRTSKHLPPSIESNICHTVTWVTRFLKISPVTEISIEEAKFDTQRMQNPEISGVEYQQGELRGYEVREYLLEKFNRTCAYCQGKNIPLEIDHITPKSRGGSDRVSNLTLACKPCNQEKGNKTATEYGHPHVENLAKKPLRDASAMNVTRPILLKRLQALNLPIETGTGAQTKYNRIQRGLEKTHYNDAACVGSSTPQILKFRCTRVLVIKATGHGSRQMCRVDKYGFPRTGSKKEKRQFGFQTGDMVKAVVVKGKKKGTYTGKVAVRSSGYFNITTPTGVVQGINHSYYRLLHKADGYSYSFIEVLPLRPEGRSIRA
jgi:5-methylcytosine-specific restriction endonuclease McrA